MAPVANGNARSTKKFKIIVIGDSNVGKTTITYRFCEEKFLDGSVPTIGVDYREKSFKIDDEDITFQFWDTAGQERFRNSITPNYYRDTDAVILVYDVTNSASFESLKKWVEESNMHCMPDVPKILIGNKCDMKKEIIISTIVAQKFADINNMLLFETSARLDSEYDYVESIFLTLAHKLKNRKKYLPINDILRLSSSDIPDSEDKKWYCCYLF